MNTKDSWLRCIMGVCIARPLNAIGVTQKTVITVRLVIGLLAALGLALGPTWFSVAAGLFLIGVFLQRADAEFCLLADEVNSVSDRYAYNTNNICNALAFLGLGVGLRFSEFGLLAIVMGLIAGIAAVAFPWLIKRLEIIDGKRSAEFDGVAGVDADDLLLLVPFALWMGWAEALLVVAAFGGSALVGAMYVMHYRKFSSE
jgi:hypothetical protein